MLTPLSSAELDAAAFIAPADLARGQQLVERDSPLLGALLIADEHTPDELRDEMLELFLAPFDNA